MDLHISTNAELKHLPTVDVIGTVNPFKESFGVIVYRMV